MQCITEMSSSQLRLLDVITISLVDDDTVCHLHYTTLDTLQFISCSGKLYQQEEKSTIE